MNIINHGESKISTVPTKSLESPNICQYLTFSAILCLNLCKDIIKLFYIDVLHCVCSARTCVCEGVCMCSRENVEVTSYKVL